MASLIIALDFPTARQALSFAGCVRGHASWLKIGLELFTAEGPDIVRQLKSEGFHIFLDLKFYDIPNTVAGAVRAACNLGVDILTLHCQGGRRMAEAATGAAREFPSVPLLFGVTALTSFAVGEMPGIALEPEAYASFLAGEASRWGLDGIVCSGREAAEIKRKAPDLLLLCPGIRPAGLEGGDQRRVVSPAAAVAAGADFLVIGRPITGAANPAFAVDAVMEEMARAEMALAH